MKTAIYIDKSLTPRYSQNGWPERPKFVLTKYTNGFWNDYYKAIEKAKADSVPLENPDFIWNHYKRRTLKPDSFIECEIGEVTVYSIRSGTASFQVSFDHDKETESLKEQLDAANKRIKNLENDLLDALDLKAGKGPTALSMLSARIEELEEMYFIAEYALRDIDLFEDTESVSDGLCLRPQCRKHRERVSNMVIIALNKLADMPHPVKNEIK